MAEKTRFFADVDMIGIVASSASDKQKALTEAMAQLKPEEEVLQVERVDDGEHGWRITLRTNGDDPGY